MDLMLALNVTIYGLGIVFLALLVLMVVIMLLGKVFAVTTGRDVLPTPQMTAPPASPLLVAPVGPTPALSGSSSTAPATSAEAAEPVSAPLPGRILSVAVKNGDLVRVGDELCVIEAMKMGNSVKAPRSGFVADVRVAPGATVAFGAPLMFLASTAAAAAPRVAAPSATPSAAEAAEPSAFTLGMSGKTHAVELSPAGGGALAVLLDGTRYEVRRDAGNRHNFIVDGRAHTVEVRETAGSTVTVVVDGISEKLEMGRHAQAAPRTLSLVSGGKPYKAEVTGGDGTASVMLDGTIYRVQRDKADPGRIVVNGQAHTVEVRETAGSTVTVVVDGRIEKLHVSREGGPPAGEVAPAVSASAAGGGAPVTAPLPGKILSVAVKVGDPVRVGDELCVIEAMKMGNSVKVQRDGVIREILVAPGQTVAFGATLAVLG